MNPSDQKALFWTLGILGLALIVGKTFNVGSVNTVDNSGYDNRLLQMGGAATNIDDAGKQFVKNNEGLNLNAYADAGGYSIGYGHYMGTTATMDSIDQATADSLFDGDIQKVVAAINANIQVPLTQNQFNALCDFGYNLGVGVFKTSTLAQKLNNADYSGAADEFDKWVYSQGQINSALVARRAAEKSLFLS